MTRYISAADTAKLIRAQLKTKFPGVKFSVRTHSYAGGASINVDWVDGPTAAMVDQVVKPYQGQGFDGMIDMAYSIDAFLLPDGSAAFAQTTGTEGSLGSVERGKVFKPVAEAERVHFLASYVFTKRTCSERLVRGALLAFGQRYGKDAAAKLKLVTSSFDGAARLSLDSYDHDDQWIERTANDMVRRRMIARA